MSRARHDQKINRKGPYPVATGFEKIFPIEKLWLCGHFKKINSNSFKVIKKNLVHLQRRLTKNTLHTSYN